MVPIEYPKPATELDSEPGVLSGSTGEFVLFGRAPAAATEARDSRRNAEAESRSGRRP